MRVTKYGLMEIACDHAQHTLSVKWSDELSVESYEFFQSITILFPAIQENQVYNLMVDSGIPAGGVLTEQIIDFFIQNIPNTPLKNIAILESPDYLWDDNLYQMIALLVTSYRLPIAVKLVKSREAGMEWFLRTSPPK